MSRCLGLGGGEYIRDIIILHLESKFINIWEMLYLKQVLGDRLLLVGEKVI